ncbi:MAG: CBS domain-containing protein [Nevskiales bacterium]|nr:CBS domain-containing protein [Nevskiales bacterium]
MLHSITVKDFMAESLLTFTPDMDVMEAIHKLVDRCYSGAPVTDNLGNVIGILSEHDCLNVAIHASYHGVLGGRVADYMSKNAVTVESETSILEVAKMFIDRPYKRYPVVEDNRLVGIISRSDVLRAIDQINDSSNA